MPDDRDLSVLSEALARLEEGFVSLPPFEASFDDAGIRRVLYEAATRLQDNFPYPHPLYVGQMLKPPHPVARIAYQLALSLNPNNHALDGGRASSAMEKEAVAHLAQMVGWSTHLGHLCGGGTLANLEALWVAREQRPGKALAASTQAHYTHERLCGVLHVPFRRVATDRRGRLDVDALGRVLDSGDVGTVVVTLGTTAAGAVDPLDRVLEFVADRDVRVHVDAAYGGYFTLASTLDADARRAFDAVSRADSIVIDPHKHGLQPYGCGCVLFRDPAVGAIYRHDSPYTYFSSDALHLGEISLECSRAGASAVALWATQRLLPCERGGTFAADLDRCRKAALTLYAALGSDDRFRPLFAPELDIIAWAVAAPTSGAASERAQQIFEAAARHDLHLALAAFPRDMAAGALPDVQWDTDTVTCLRACSMKPEHEAWTQEILERLDAATGEALTHAP